MKPEQLHDRRHDESLRWGVPSTCSLARRTEMKLTGLLIWLAAVSVSMIAAGSSYSAEKNLGEILRESQCDRIIGTWADEETNGKSVKISHIWRFEDRVLEVASELKDLKTVALMGRNAQTGEVFHLGADNKGGSSIGNWRFENDEATLEVSFVTGEGQEGGVIIRYRLKDENTMIVSIEAEELVTFTMIRTKKREPEKASSQ
jgi:hypothetical protein